MKSRKTKPEGSSILKASGGFGLVGAIGGVGKLRHSAIIDKNESAIPGEGAIPEEAEEVEEEKVKDPNEEFIDFTEPKMEDEKMTEEEMKEALMDRNESKTTTCQNRFRSNWNRYTFF